MIRVLSRDVHAIKQMTQDLSLPPSLGQLFRVIILFAWVLEHLVFNEIIERIHLPMGTATTSGRLL